MAYHFLVTVKQAIPIKLSSDNVYDVVASNETRAFVGLKDITYEHTHFRQTDLVFTCNLVFEDNMFGVHYHPGRGHNTWSGIWYMAINLVSWLSLLAAARGHVNKTLGAFREEEHLKSQIVRALPVAAIGALNSTQEAMKRSADTLTMTHYFSDASKFPVEGYYDENNELQVRGKILKQHMLNVPSG